MRLTTTDVPADQPGIVVEIEADAEALGRSFVAYLEAQAQAGVQFREGQTVELGWLLLLLRESGDKRLEVFEPDFKSVPIRWCRGINNAAKHLYLQRAVCELLGCEPVFPGIRQAGIISPKFFESRDYTMSRDAPTGSDSGWVFAESGYAGSEGDFCSLYELSLHKPEVVPFLALPASGRVIIKPGYREVTVASTTCSSADHELLRVLAV